MSRNTVSVAISLPKDIVNKIETRRGELTRSLVYKKILAKGLEVSDQTQNSNGDDKNEFGH